MNFIVVVCDTLRRDHVGAYSAQPQRWESGGEWTVETPNFDRFAAGACLFENAYIGSFPTVPNRREIFTGRSVFTYAEWAPLPASEVVISETLANAGYTTMLIADTPHILQRGFHFDRGFTAWDWIRGQENDRLYTHPPRVEFPAAPEKLREPDATMRQYLRNIADWQDESDRFCPTTFTRACQWLEQNTKNKPFFLHVDTFDPHEPWDPPQSDTDRYDPGYEGQRVTYPVYGYWADFLSQDELRHSHALYCGEVSMVDRWFGRILDTMDRLDLWDDTTLILTSDHGFYFGEHGIIGKSIIEPNGPVRPHPLLSEVARIPLIAHIPGLTEPGMRPDGYVQPLDLMPTFLEMANLDSSGVANGKSLVPLVTGQTDKLREFAVSSHSICTPLAGRPSTVVTPDWTLVLGAPRPASETGGDASQTNTEVIDSRRRVEQASEAGTSPQLYDNHADPGMTRNVIEDHPDEASELRDLYIGYIESVGTAEEYVAPRREARLL